MRLLFDQNLSYRLARFLADLYPGSEHVRGAGMAPASDTEVWEYAGAQGLTIVSKDSDFHQRSLVFGSPPKVIWLRVGNCTTAEAEAMIRRNASIIAAFEADPDATFLPLEP